MLHWKAPQGSGVTIAHAPVPVQFDAAVKLPPLHKAGAHWWLVATLWQALLPSHVPSLPH
jgi:hypothetical protein